MADASIIEAELFSERGFLVASNVIKKKTSLVPVEDRTKETLIPIIKQWIKPGTLIVSDGWKIRAIII